MRVRGGYGEATWRLCGEYIEGLGGGYEEVWGCI